MRLIARRGRHSASCTRCPPQAPLCAFCCSPARQPMRRRRRSACCGPVQASRCALCGSPARHAPARRRRRSACKVARRRRRRSALHSMARRGAALHARCAPLAPCSLARRRRRSACRGPPQAPLCMLAGCAALVLQPATACQSASPPHKRDASAGSPRVNTDKRAQVLSVKKPERRNTKTVSCGGGDGGGDCSGDGCEDAHE